MKKPQDRSHAANSSYRPDIDGLRAVAILSVLFYHAKLGFPGGFVGVDVFFVISGYLISSLILKELAEDRFSLARFWERRIRRIMPASLAMVLVTTIAGWFLLLPKDFEALGKSVFAQAAMVSNFYFLSQMGYFSPASDTLPLLHTWSLAVEEQFYFILPLLLLWLWKTQRRWIPWAILSITLISFVLSLVGTRSNPDATFFLLPARAWELLIGTLLALVQPRISPGRTAREVAGWAGLALVSVPLFLYGHQTVFPGLAAVPPCLGAALIIFSSGSSVSTVGRILSWRPIVFIGLISYSLYLWHWPVLVFARYVSLDFEGLGVGVRFGLVLASVALAIGSWRWVERPFRDRTLLKSQKHAFAFASVAIVVSLGAGFAVARLDGFPSRLPPKAIELANSRNNRAFRSELNLQGARESKFVELGTKNPSDPISVFVWGDSHAMAATPAIDEFCRRNTKRGLQAAHSSTPPVLDVVGTAPYSLKSESPAYNESVLRFIETNRIKHVVLAAYWSSYLGMPGFTEKLIKTIDRLRASGTAVYILKEVPHPGFDVPRTTAITAFQGGDLDLLGISQETHRRNDQRFVPILERLQHLGATPLDTAHCFTNQHGLYRVVKNDVALYWDDHHLTVEGAKLIVPVFEAAIRFD